MAGKETSGPLARANLVTPQWDSGAGVKENAALRLPEIADAYFIAGDGLFTGAQTPEELHEFRLKTKHFRYTLELFEEQYGFRFSLLMKRLKPVQDALGDINDAATALHWMQDGESGAAREYLTARIEDKSKAFEKYWRSAFQKKGERERWAAVLSRPLRGKRKK